MRTLVTTVVIALITYFLGLNSSRKQTLRDARLRVYGDLIAFTSTFRVTPQQILDSEHLDDLIKLIAPARLLASDNTEDKMRDYFDEFNHLCKSLKQGETKVTAVKLTKIAMDLEESMRVDLGVRFRPRKFSARSS